ncbi:MAG: rhodanese-like domain-containing protein, partial [Acidimicrobiales bacterium]
MSTTPTMPITTADLRTLRLENPDLRVIDVRTGGEFETVHIPGSHNIPLDTLGEHADELAAIDHSVVLVCQSGARANQARAKLDSAGKTGLYVREGGMAAWQGGGGDVA